MERIYYVYLHITKDTKEVFYVGKGKNDRAFRKEHRNKYWHNIVKKHGYEVELKKTELTEEEAFLLEKETIKDLSPKANLTDGGQGTSGFRHSPELVKWRNENNRKINRTYEGFLKKSLAQKEAQNRPEVIKKRTAGKKAYLDKIKTGELPNPWAGKKYPPEFGKKVSAAKKGIDVFAGKIRPNAKPVLNLDTGEVFQSLVEAARSVGGNRIPMARALNAGRRYKKVKFIWHKTRSSME